MPPSIAGELQPPINPVERSDVMSGLGNDYVSDAAADAAIAGFAQLGAAKGTLAAAATTVAAGVGTAVAMAVPLAVAAVVIWAVTSDESAPTTHAAGEDGR
jgi:hypothetical protein